MVSGLPWTKPSRGARTASTHQSTTLILRWGSSIYWQMISAIGCRHSAGIWEFQRSRGLDPTCLQLGRIAIQGTPSFKITYRAGTTAPERNYLKQINHRRNSDPR
ncbi:hypothetical protein PGT21_010766 [Puccinia graminis f. sp. tritici]|uniref:Uncharacterized protein n=1 Tax=Puccinia graminis f. sp. tritici TaxID=56615 RepID=A0A5B0LZ04_PUCGR|nr:hypothetical protein PGT21_010766 [Puccinia graminis f. sp. tritici]